MQLRIHRKVCRALLCFPAMNGAARRGALCCPRTKYRTALVLQRSTTGLVRLGALHCAAQEQSTALVLQRSTTGLVQPGALGCPKINWHINFCLQSVAAAQDWVTCYAHYRTNVCQQANLCLCLPFEHQAASVNMIQIVQKLIQYPAPTRNTSSSCQNTIGTACARDARTNFNGG